MPGKKWQYLDEHLRLRLVDLPSRQFEEFFLHFLNAGISLTIERHGAQMTRRVISADTYAAGSGRDQKGVDLLAKVESGEVWAFQCKRHETWSVAQTRKAIEKASEYKAQHYFLVVACDPHKDVQDEIQEYPNWTFWNLDRICAEIRLRVPPSKHAQVLSFLPREDLKQFVPFTTESLIPPEKFFEPMLGGGKLFRHDWKLVGRERELQTLRDFASSKNKVQVLSAKGGAGKSRLLREFCRVLADESPEIEILCLNPHRSGDDLSFAFVGDSPRRMVIVDDAHRTEQVPLQLLSLVRQDTVSKIVLATRPQGSEALTQRLYEAGLSDGDVLAPPLSLGILKKPDVKALALEVLGAELKEHAGALAELTADSPFLTVIAGELLRVGRLKWCEWASHEEFRQHVFREFEQKNFENIPEADRDSARGLIRLLSLLAPAIRDASFSEKAARCLGCSIFALETQLNRLRQSELVAGRDDGLRIVPDLFSDFLVYDACYGPKKTPGFVQRILSEFSDRSGALVRNLADATWIARANGVADDALLKTVLEPERKRFEAASFYQRAQMLRHWSSFSVYLPAETLELACLALKLTTAPRQESEWTLLFGRLGLDSYRYVCEQIPALVRPVAKFCKDHRHEALTLLWDLGLHTEWVAMLGSNQNHPWSVIADVIKYEPRKYVRDVLSALDWFEGLVRKPETLVALEGPTPILRTFLGPCFERFVQFSEWDDRTASFWQQPVSVEKTKGIRERALGIVESVIEHGTSLAALDALSALETAIHRASPMETRQVQDEARFRVEWRPERLKALAIYEKAVATHPGVAVHYEIRQTLKGDLVYEEDPEFAKEARRVLTLIPETLELRVAVVMLSGGASEFEDKIAKGLTLENEKKAEALWKSRIYQVASELVAKSPAADSLFSFLNRLAGELVKAGNHLFLSRLFTQFSETAPALAAGLAEQILTTGSKDLAGEWPVLIETNSAIEPSRRIDLFRKAAASRIPGASAAVVRILSWKARESILSDTERTLLLEIAVRCEQEEARYLLQLVEWSSEANLPWAFQILDVLPIRPLAEEMLEQLLQTMVPYKERETGPPDATVQHVLKQLVTVRELLLLNSKREWDVLIETYPREIYELIRARIAYASSDEAEDDYKPVPHDYENRLDLPALVKEPDYPAICDDLWNRVSNPDEKERWSWFQLFQAVVFEDPSRWSSRMLKEIEAATSEKALFGLAQLLNFEGSLIIFRFPQITRAFLERAKALGNDRLLKTVRAELYSGCGPQSRSYEGGVLDKELDYVEAEATKAAEAHASDELLGTFYRWIVEVEQKERLRQKMQTGVEMADLN